jgi:hypothetical protein
MPKGISCDAKALQSTVRHLVQLRNDPGPETKGISRNRSRPVPIRASGSPWLGQMTENSMNYGCADLQSMIVVTRPRATPPPIPEGKLKKYACQEMNQNNPRCD